MISDYYLQLLFSVAWIHNKWYPSFFGFNGEFSFRWSKSTRRLSTVSFAGKDLIFPILICFTNRFSHCVKESIEKMAEESQSKMISVNAHPMKINVAKFDGTNNFGT